MENGQQKNGIAKGLMGTSLILLALFLAVWLHSLHQQEVDRLKEKSSFIFIDAMKTAEADYLKEALVANLMGISGANGDSIKITSFKVSFFDEETIDEDTIDEEETVLSAFDSMGLNMESNIKITVNAQNRFDKEKIKTFGNVVTWILEEKKEDDPNFLNNLPRDSFLINAVSNLIAASPKITELPPNFKVIKIEDSITVSQAVTTDIYQDHDSGDQFALAFDQFNWYIFHQLWVQIGFSIFLFALTATSFFFIYQSLKNQQLLIEQKNELVANITHELKTPIATVGVAIEALQNFGGLDDPQKTKEYLSISQQELNRLSILVDKVLNTSLFEKSDLALKQEDIDLKQLVDDVLNSMKLQFQNKKASINFNAEGNTFLVKGDKIHLTSVLYNLIDNALKYSPVNPIIDIQLAQNNGQIDLKIKDNGLGISEAYQAKIFDKFFRVPSGNTHNIKGHGLGLNYVKKVIEKHGGNIQVFSQLKEGTTFQVVLPL